MNNALLKIVITTIILLNFCSCSNSNIEIQNSNSFENPSLIIVDCVYQLLDLALDSKEKIYIAGNQNIHVVDKDKQYNFTNTSLNYCTTLTIYEDNIFTIDNVNKTINVFDAEGNLKKESKIDLDGYFLDMEVVDGKLIVLNSLPKNDKKEERKLLVLESNGKLINEIPYLNIKSFCVCNNSSIIFSVSTDTGANLVIYDFIKGKIKKSYNYDFFINNFAYDQENEAIYYPDDKCLMKLKLGDESPENILFLKGNSHYTNIVLSNNYIYLFGNPDNCIAKIDKSVTKRFTDSITILTYNEAFQRSPVTKKAIELFQEKHSKTRITFKAIDFNTYHQTLATKFMANDTDFDIFLLNNDSSYQYVKNNAMLDLSSYETIADRFKDMLPGIKNNVTCGDRISGIPCNLFLDAWMVNEELLQQTNAKYPDEHWSWDDFFIFAANANMDLNSDGKTDAYMLQCPKNIPPFIHQINCQYLDLINKKAVYKIGELENYLIQWKKVCDKGLILNSYSEHNQSKDTKVLFKIEYIGLNEGNKKLIYPPVISNTEIYPISINMLCVNSNSKKIGISLDFLSDYLSREVQTSYPETGNAFYPDISSYSDPINRYSKDTVEYMKDIFTLSNESNYAIYTNILKSSVQRRYQEDLYEYTDSIISDFLDSKIEAAEAANLIYNKAQIIVGE